MDLKNVVAISCRTNTGEMFEVPVREFFGLQPSQNSLGIGVVPKSDGKAFIASDVTEGANGQLTFKNYKSETSFTGIPIGILAFDATGRIVTVPFQQNQSPTKTTTEENPSSTSESTINKLPIWIDNNGNLGDSDIIRDGESYSVGGTIPFWKWDVYQGSVNITQSSISDGFRLNGKLVVSYDPDSGEITIGNDTYTTTNIKFINTDSVSWRASGGGTITDVAAATAGTFTLTKPAETGTYATREWVGNNGWLLGGNTLTEAESIGSLNNWDVNIIRNNVIAATVTSTGIGIGITTPSGKLQVQANVADSLMESSNTMRLYSTASGNGTAGVLGSTLIFGQRWLNSNAIPIRTGGIAGVKTAADGSFGGGIALLYQTAANVDLGIGAVLQHNGNFGINTTTPTYRLDVNGTGHFSGAVTFDTVPSSLQDATSANHLVRYSQWIGATYLKPYNPVVKTVSFTSLTKSGLYAINGYTPTAGEYVLDAFGDTGSGIWAVDSGAWSRPTDANEDSELRGFIVSIQAGTYAGYKYLNTNTSAITINTTPITYSEWSNNVETDPIFTAWRDAIRTANTVWAAPNGSNGAPAWRALVTADISDLSIYTRTESDARFQPLDSDLTAIAALTGTDAVLIKSEGSWVLDTNTYLNTATVTSFRATSSTLGVVVPGPTMQVDSFGGINQKSGIVTVGTYRSVTVDTYGRVTAGTNPTTLSGYGITDAYTKTESDTLFGGKQNQLNGTGYVKMTGTTVSYDNRDFVDTTTLQATIAGQKTFTAPFTITPDGSGTTVTVTSYTNNGTKIPRIQAALGIYGESNSAISFYASKYFFKGGSLRLSGGVGAGGSIANITDPTERLDVDGNIRYTTLLKPNNTAGTDGQFLSTSGTQDIWKTLTVSDISNISSTYQPILPSGTAGQFLIRNASNVLEWSTLELEPVGLSNNKIAVGDSANYLSEYNNFEFLESRFISIYKISDNTRALYLGLESASNNSFITAAGGRLTLKADSGVYLHGFTGIGNRMVIVDGDGKLGFTEIPSGGSGGSPLTSSYIGYGSTINTVTGNATFTYLGNRYIHFTNSGSDFNVGTTGASGFVESVNGNLLLQARSSFGVVVDQGFFKVNNLAGTGTRMVVTDSTGLLSTQTIPSGGGVPALTATRIGFGDGSNLLTSSANFVYDAAKTAMYFNDGSNYLYVGKSISVSDMYEVTAVGTRGIQLNTDMDIVIKNSGNLYLGAGGDNNRVHIGRGASYNDADHYLVINGETFSFAMDNVPGWGDSNSATTPQVGDKVLFNVVDIGGGVKRFVPQKINKRVFSSLTSGDFILTL